MLKVTKTAPDVKDDYKAVTSKSNLPSVKRTLQTPVCHRFFYAALTNFKMNDELLFAVHFVFYLSLRSLISYIKLLLQGKCKLAILEYFSNK